MEEIWKPVPQLSGFYEASDLGRLRRARSGNSRTFVGRICKTRVRGTSPYEYVYLMVNRKRIDALLHRLVCEAFYGTASSGCEVNHKNQVKTDNRADNLEWTTHSENVKQAAAKISFKMRGMTRDERGRYLPKGENKNG